MSTLLKIADFHGGGEPAVHGDSPENRGRVNHFHARWYAPGAWFTVEIQRIEAHMSSVFDFATSIKSVSRSVLMAMLTHNFLTKFTIFCLHSSFLLSLFPRSL